MSWQKRGPNQGTIPHVENQFTHFQWFTAASNSRITHSTATLRPRTAPASIQQRPISPPATAILCRDSEFAPGGQALPGRAQPFLECGAPAALLQSKRFHQIRRWQLVATPPCTPATDTPSTLVPKWNGRRKHAPPSPSQFPVSNFRPTQSGCECRHDQ